MGRRLGFELDAPEANSGTGSESHLATYISKGFKPEPIDIRGLRDLKKKKAPFWDPIETFGSTFMDLSGFGPSSSSTNAVHVRSGPL